MLTSNSQAPTKKPNFQEMLVSFRAFSTKISKLSLSEEMARLPLFLEKPNSPASPKKKSTRGGASSSIPEPFGNWILDVRVKTKEDFLIKGNIAKGRVTADIAVKGTVAKPKPLGKATIVNAEASLPFSQLYVKNGLITFTPETGLDPRLNVKAISRIGSNDVELTVYGRASNPKHLLSSSPPLPENEIVFLLATGSTSDKLSNSGAATGKAYQLLLDSWLRSSPGKLKTLKA